MLDDCYAMGSGHLGKMKINTVCTRLASQMQEKTIPNLTTKIEFTIRMVVKNRGAPYTFYIINKFF